jgi:hypothetical protein
MADRVVKVIATFSDKAGTDTRSQFLIKGSFDVDGSLIHSDTNSDAKAIVDKLEAMSNLKFESAQVLVALSLGGTSLKSSPVAGSSVKKQGWLEFFGDLGDSLKRSKTRIWVPSPKDSKLAGNNTRFDLSDSDVDAARAAIIQMVKTLGGTSLTTVGGTNARIRRTRK